MPSTSAAREWVTDRVTGLIFQGGNSTDLGKKIVYLLDHPEIAAALGREAYRRYWQQPATMDRHCEALEIIYRQMLA